MAHDPSFLPKFLVQETGHQKLESKLRTQTQETGTKNMASPISSVQVTNRTLPYCARVSGARKIWYQNARHTSKVTGASFWYQKLGWITWVVCHAP